TAFYSDERAILQSGQPLVNQEEMSMDAKGNARWTATSKVPLRNRQGETIGIIGIGRDITVAKQAEEAVRKSEASFRSVVEGAPYGIFRASVDGRFLRVNSALQEMLGYPTSKELLNVTLGENVFRNPADFQHLVALMGNAGNLKTSRWSGNVRMASPSRCYAAAGEWKAGMRILPITRSLSKISPRDEFSSGSSARQRRWRLWGVSRGGLPTISIICWE